jgi:hypothetical protein
MEWKLGCFTHTINMWNCFLLSQTKIYDESFYYVTYYALIKMTKYVTIMKYGNKESMTLK